MQMQVPFYYSKVSVFDGGGAAATVIRGEEAKYGLSVDHLRVGLWSNLETCRKRGSPLVCVFTVEGKCPFFFLEKGDSRKFTPTDEASSNDGTCRSVAYPALALCLAPIVPRASLKNRQQPCRSIWTA